jgi:hypothetical protein
MMRYDQNGWRVWLKTNSVSCHKGLILLSLNLVARDA